MRKYVNTLKMCGVLITLRQTAVLSWHIQSGVLIFAFHAPWAQSQRTAPVLCTALFWLTRRGTVMCHANGEQQFDIHSRPSGPRLECWAELHATRSEPARRHHRLPRER